MRSSKMIWEDKINQSQGTSKQSDHVPNRRKQSSSINTAVPKNEVPYYRNATGQKMPASVIPPKGGRNRSCLSAPYATYDDEGMDHANPNRTKSDSELRYQKDLPTEQNQQNYDRTPPGDYTVGIDMGTDNCSISVTSGGEVVIVNTVTGRNSMASCVTETARGVLVGDQALDHLTITPDKTIYGLKRLFTNKTSDESGCIAQQHVQQHTQQHVQQHTQQHAQQHFQQHTQQHAQRHVQQHGRSDTKLAALPWGKKIPSSTVKSTLHQVYQHILKEMKEMLPPKMKSKKVAATIAVPAFYNSTQREVICQAASAAGFHRTHLINETSAVAALYASKNPYKGPRYMIIISFGAGHLEVALFSSQGSGMECLGVESNSSIGGRDFDQVIFDICKKELRDKYHIDISSDGRAVQRLYIQAERAKRVLSTGPVVQIQVERLVRNIDFTTTIRRNTFEEASEYLIQSVIDTVKKLLRTCGQTKDDLDQVLLTGGATRIPIVQQKLSEIFSPRLLNKTLQTDNTVALGAGVAALRDPLLVAPRLPYAVSAGGRELIQPHAALPLQRSYAFQLRDC